MAASLPLGLGWPKDNQLELVPNTSATFHAYVHIPFCAVRCGYCDFNTYTSKELRGVSQADFHIPLIQEVDLSKELLSSWGIPDRKLTTVFFGGGTPSMFEASQISAILESLKANFGFTDDIEITLEANPEGLDHIKLDQLKLAGVNRISLGVQSFDQQVLDVLDRVHSRDKVIAAVRLARELGFRVSVDLIYGAPGESLESWEATLRQALELAVEHVSAYSLIIEEGTAIARKISRGELADVDEDLNADKYLLTEKLLTEAGLKNYEVSNWGNPSRHNRAYWESQDWWGYGPGAHSHIAGARFWNQKHPATYAAALEKGSPAHGFEYLDPRTQLEEQLLLMLRTDSGVSSALLRELGVPNELVANAIANGLLQLAPGGKLVATLNGRLLVDGLVLDFLSKSKP
ncbi:MAG: radical SAM family heme chaperone HemW [Actinomycetota bacterium]|nr:radical SAM family heme chaperone HemW [Actinomycetota bacterium]